MKKLTMALLVGCFGLNAASLAHSEGGVIERAQELRQAAMTLIGNDFGFMKAMAKGDIPWNDAQFMARGRELGAIGQLDLLRGFVPDSYHGQTHAKPDIELDRDDFDARMHKLEKNLRALGASPDAQVMKARFKDLGQDCRGCHKKFKAKEMIGNG